MPFVDVASPRIDYRRIGTACAHSPTLVFLHEGLGSVARWRDFPDRVAQAASVLAKACPLDFHPHGFVEAACAQSVLGRVNAL